MQIQLVPDLVAFFYNPISVLFLSISQDLFSLASALTKLNTTVSMG